MPSRRLTSIVVASLASLVVLALGALVISGRAGAGALGYGMTSGHHGSTYGSAMMTGSRRRQYLTTAAGTATLLIRHQREHCHAWSLNGGPFKAAQHVSLPTGSTLTVVDDDVMPHRMVELAGSRVTMRNGTTMPMTGGYVSRTPGLMNHMGAWTKLTFPQAGVYRFRTHAGEDYMPRITTVGADNVLTLTVTVR